MKVPKYIQYAQDVLEGKVVTGELVRLACERFFRFMEDDRYEFREDAVERVIKFFGLLKHFKGRHAYRPFVLEPWQEFALASIFGFFVKKDGRRLTRNVYIDCARKQGKTALAGGLCCYALIYDKEMGAEVDLAANSRDQAQIAFEFCSRFCQGLNPSGHILKTFKNKITFDRTKSVLHCFAAQDSKLDGYGASLYLLDEFHASKDGRLKGVLASSQGQRENPLGVVITTAGFDKGGPCYEYRTVCAEILHGVKEDDSQFSLIYTIDDGDDWRDESVWPKSNPNLGVTVDLYYIRNEVKRATNNPSEEVNVKTKNLNIWCDAETVWIPDHYILNATQKLDYKQFEGQDCYVGIDLASTGDLTAISFMVPKEDKYYFFSHSYLPEAALREGKNSIQYAEWRRRGQLTITPGNVTDYEYILADLLKVNQCLRIQSVAYDPYNSTQFVISATDAGLPMEPYAQNLGNFNRPTRELERLILSGRVVIDNNEITRYCFRNVTLRHDHNGNVKPSKEYESSGKRIDIVVAMLEALGSYLASPRYGEFY